MTAISGAKCDGGVLLYADKNVIATDGGVTQACKIYRRNVSSGTVAIASACDDAIASQDISRLLLDGLAGSRCSTLDEVVEFVRNVLAKWSEPYALGELNAQFLMTVGLNGRSELYVVQPRNVVAPVDHNVCLGSGGRVMEQLLPRLFGDNMLLPPKTALFFLAYATKQAKDQEALVGKGSPSNAIFVKSTGGYVWIPEVELFTAEELIFSADGIVNDVRRLLLSLQPDEYIHRMVKLVADSVASTAKNLSKAVDFPSLSGKML